MSARPLRLSAGLPGRIALGAAALLVALFLVFPVAIVIPLSFSGSEFLSFPPESWSLRWYLAFFTDARWLESAWLSIWIAVVAAILATLLGTAAALGLARAKFPGRALVTAFLLSPLVVPAIIVSIGVYFFYAPLGLVGSPVGIAVAHATLASPFVLVNVTAALAGFDQRLEQAAKNLGASGWSTFRLVTFPIIKPGVMAGAVFAFIASFDEMIVALFITSPGNVTLPIRMWESMRNEISPAIAAVSTLVILLSVSLFFVAARIQARAVARASGRA